MPHTAEAGNRGDVIQGSFYGSLLSEFHLRKYTKSYPNIAILNLIIPPPQDYIPHMRGRVCLVRCHQRTYNNYQIFVISEYIMALIIIIITTR